MDEASTSSSTTNLSTNLYNDLREDQLRFHKRVGSLVKLSNDACTAEWTKKAEDDEFNNGVVMTHRPLRDNELFEVYIDRLVDKLTGSIEVGVTTHSPDTLEFPAKMTQMNSGTTMLSGRRIFTDGQAIKKYRTLDLNKLQEGDRVGIVRKSNNNLHYFINDYDQGVAAEVPNTVWGVIDILGQTVKVTIAEQEINVKSVERSDRLTFHPCSRTYTALMNNGRTVRRRKEKETFNESVVLTSRPLRANELFEVRLDRIAAIWEGTIEIGVTTHSPTKQDFPYTMNDVNPRITSHTWMITDNGDEHNGTTIIDKFVENLDRLQVGDRVGVVRKDDSTLHFFINGLHQGIAATKVPKQVYGVIDLHGQAAQATIVDNSDSSSPTTESTCVVC